MKDSDCDVIVNDLLCFIENYGSTIPNELLKETIRRHFDSEAVEEAGKILGLQDFDLDRILESTARSTGGRVFAATNLHALPLVVKVGGETNADWSQNDVLVKILAEVQNLRKLVNELKSPGGGRGPNFFADGAMGDCTDSEPSPGQQNSGRTKKSGGESVVACTAQGGASLEETVKRLKERKPNAEHSRGTSSLNSSGSSTTSPKEQREKCPIPVVQSNNNNSSLFLPRFQAPTYGTIAPLYNNTKPDLFGDPASAHWLRTWLFLTANHQASGHNPQQTSNNLFPQFLGPQGVGTQFFGGHGSLFKMEPPGDRVGSPPVSLKSPSFKNGQNENFGGLKQEDSEPSTGSPTDEPLLVDTSRVGEEDDYPSPEEEDCRLDSRNSQILNDAIDKPFVCQYTNCQKRFANKFLLKKHEFIHTGERPHQCPFCLKRFNRKDNLLRHKKTHIANALNNNEKRRHTLVFGVRGTGMDGSDEMDIAQQVIRQHGLLQAQQDDLLMEGGSQSEQIGSLGSNSNNDNLNSFSSPGEQVSIL